MTIKLLSVSETPLIPTLDHRLWQNTRDINVRFSYKGQDGFVLTVPARTRSNFASIPVLLRGLLLTTSPRQCLPAFIHDAMVREYYSPKGRSNCSIYVNAYYLAEHGDMPTAPDIDWDFATEMFRALLKYYSEKSWRAKALVLGVDLWGKLKEFFNNVS